MLRVTENSRSKATVITNMHENDGPFHFFQVVRGHPCFLSRALRRLGRYAVRAIIQSKCLNKSSDAYMCA